MYEPATNHAQIKVDGVLVVDSYPFLNVDSTSSYEYLSIGSDITLETVKVGEVKFTP